MNGHAILTPVHLPSWLTLQKDFMSTDTTFYTLNGVPGFTDNGPDSAVFIVETDDPAVDGFIKRWKYSIPIFVENENQPPFFVQPGPDSVVTHSPLQLFKKTVHLRDSDQQAGKRDTLFIGYELRRLGTAAAFQPVLEPVFFDSGNGSAAFAWTPQPADAGHYRLVFFGWDYYQGLDSLAVDLHVTSATGIERTAELPVHFELYQNSPNPFNARTTIRYDLPQAERVLLRMFNERGQLVATLVSGQRAPGSHVINWDTTEMSSGIYYYVLTAGNYRALRKCVLLK